MNKTTLCAIFTLAFLLIGDSVKAASSSSDNPWIGHWALTIPGGRAGWLGVEEVEGRMQARILWGGGSVVPVTSVEADGDRLLITRVQRLRRGKDKGKEIVETITATVSGDQLSAVTVKQRPDGSEFARASLTGHRTPPLPPKPDLTQVNFAEPISLLNGKDLSGWRSLDPNAAMGWHVDDGVLMNRTHHEDGGSGGPFANIRTEQEFDDFRLTLETRTLKGSNSGVYLRGIYEVQIFESYGRPVDSHHMGAIYSRITPAVAAEKPIGQWQTLDITLVDRHATVILNGETIIDNQAVLGCTGGALWSDPMRRGPIYLQGNHSDIDFRNLMIRPVVKASP